MIQLEASDQARERYFALERGETLQADIYLQSQVGYSDRLKCLLDSMGIRCRQDQISCFAEHARLTQRQIVTMLSLENCLGAIALHEGVAA